EALVIAVDGTHLPRPGAGDAQVARAGASDRAAVAVDQLRHDAEEGPAGRAWLHVVRAGQGGDHDPAGFGLPPGIDDRAAPVADDAPVPEPGLGIDRLADRAEQADRRAIMGLHRPFARAHQRPD